MISTFNTDDNVAAACREIVTKTADRKSILIFASGVAHAENIALEITKYGHQVGVITGDTLPMIRQQLLAEFKSQKLRWLINCDVLTTGFDAPCIDAIAVLRATMSPGLFAQIVGRGLRKHEDKNDCLILDFGENIKRHGSLDDPEYGRATGGGFKGSGNLSAVDKNGRGKECFNCRLDVAANAKVCPDCGFEFPVNHNSEADEDSELTGTEEPEKWDVESYTYHRHTKRNDPDAPPTLRVDYNCRPQGVDGNLKVERVSEWICFEHKGFAKQKALLWWQTRSLAEPPTTIEDAISWLGQGVARMSARITTQRDGKWRRITAVEFDDEIPDESEWTEFVEDQWAEEVPF